MKYMIDDGITEVFTNSLKEARKLADEMKKKHPLRVVYIGKFTQGINGDEYDVVGEA